MTWDIWGIGALAINVDNLSPIFTSMVLNKLDEFPVPAGTIHLKQYLHGAGRKPEHSLYLEQWQGSYCVALPPNAKAGTVNAEIQRKPIPSFSVPGQPRSIGRLSPFPPPRITGPLLRTVPWVLHSLCKGWCIPDKKKRPRRTAEQKNRQIQRELDLYGESYKGIHRNPNCSIGITQGMGQPGRETPGILWRQKENLSGAMGRRLFMTSYISC